MVDPVASSRQAEQPVEKAHARAGLAEDRITAVARLCLRVLPQVNPASLKAVQTACKLMNVRNVDLWSNLLVRRSSLLSVRGGRTVRARGSCPGAVGGTPGVQADAYSNTHHRVPAPLLLLLLGWWAQDHMERHLDAERSGVPMSHSSRRPVLTEDYFKLIEAGEGRRGGRSSKRVSHAGVVGRLPPPLWSSWRWPSAHGATLTFPAAHHHLLARHGSTRCKAQHTHS